MNKSIKCTQCGQSKNFADVKIVHLQSFGERVPRDICRDCVSAIKLELAKEKAKEKNIIRGVHLVTCTSCIKQTELKNTRNVIFKSLGETDRRIVCNNCVSLFNKEKEEADKKEWTTTLSKLPKVDIHIKTKSYDPGTSVIFYNDSPICCINNNYYDLDIESVKITALTYMVQQLTQKVDGLQSTIDSLTERIEIMPNGDEYELYKDDFEGKTKIEHM